MGTNSPSSPSSPSSPPPPPPQTRLLGSMLDFPQGWAKQLYYVLNVTG
ncbi:MAG TPA: hypothetical protein V6D25_30600 [Leptolyngbyaceae cyanobacterium]